MSAFNSAAYPADRRLSLVREFNAPRPLVWKAFTDPYHLSQWWGPKGFTNPVCELDLRVGGRWHHEMQGPDGNRYPVDCIFLEVTPPERLVYRNDAATACVFGDNPPPSFVQALTLESIGNRTRLTLDAYFDSTTDRDAVARRGFAEGTNEGFDKLDAVLAQSAGSGAVSP
jgi:uncharacterized protein YndB with AHSA1/START domain